MFWSIPHCLKVIGKMREKEVGEFLGYVTTNLFTTKTEQVGGALCVDFVVGTLPEGLLNPDRSTGNKQP